jgi:hypothetical protein
VTGFEALLLDALGAAAVAAGGLLRSWTRRLSR